MNDQITQSSIIALTNIGKIGEQQSYRPSDNDSPLGEKFQFSSVLKSTIDTVEKTYSDAQKVKEKENNLHPIETTSSDDNSFSKDLDKEPMPSDAANPDEIYESDDEAKQSNLGRPMESPQNTEKSEAEEGPEPAQDHAQLNSGRENSGNQVFGENQSKVVTSQNAASISAINPIEQNHTNNQLNTNPGNSSAKPINQNLSNEESVIPTMVTNTKNDAAKAGEKPTSRSNSFQSTLKNTGELTSAINPEKKTAEGSENLSKIVSRNSKQEVAQQNMPSSTNSNLNKQAQDLSNRLKNKPTSPVKVSVENNIERFDPRLAQNAITQLNTLPSHTKAPIAQLAEISLEEGQFQVSKSSVNKINVLGDPKALNGHSIKSGNETSLNARDAHFLSQTQMLRQQAASLGLQQSAASQANMGNKAPIMVDMPGINAVSGPNQTQQVTKTVAPPPPPPPKPPMPIEQVAVQIKKAIGEGADKINIKLHPANLGKVEVRMDIGKDGVLTALIIAEKPETLDMLQRDVRGLEKVLQDGGLKTDTQSFNFSLKEQAQEKSSNEHGEGRVQTEDETPTLSENEADDNDNLLSESPIYGQNVATNGGVDITI